LTTTAPDVAVPKFGLVRYRWDDWYVRVLWPNGQTYHSQPWRSMGAAQYALRIMRDQWASAVRRTTGNGDTCPLFPEHGPMLVLEGRVPMQYCPHAQHEGTLGDDGPAASRAMWPLFGLEDTVASYIARLDRQIRENANGD
jgi:hypothetical protein